MFTRPRLGLVALLCAVAFAAGALFARPLSAGRFDPYRKLGVFSKVLSYIENIYVENVSEADLMYGAARGLTDVLDPHSRFMDPTEYANLKREIEGATEIEGIGIDIEKTKKRLVIVSPIEGSPAARAGIEPGDVIRKIDGTDADNIEWEDAIGRLKGPAGTEVVLVIERAGAQRTLRIKREKFEAVLNCAAFTDVDGAETNVEKCYEANALGVENLALASKEIDCRFVTISTDYIFDGLNAGFYTQRDMPNPHGVYARSKLEGEIRGADHTRYDRLPPAAGRLVLGDA